MTSPATGLAAHILVIGGEPLALRWSLVARYRLQGLPRTSSFADLIDPERAVAAALNFAWAMLPDAARFTTPEALAVAVDAEAGGMDRLDAALTAALQVAFPDGPAAEAKKASTDSSPAPASSSG